MSSGAEKIRPELARAIQQSSGDQMLELIVELDSALAPPPKAPPAASRAARIAAAQESFSEQLRPVEQLIQDGGGEVLERAWINSSVRARVPANFVPKLSRATEIAVRSRPRGA